MREEITLKLTEDEAYELAYSFIPDAETDPIVIEKVRDKVFEELHILNKENESRYRKFRYQHDKLTGRV